MTEVSVIMATYKEPENQLRRSIESILNQTYKAFEYIIILDNPDNSDHIRIIKEYQQKDNRIQFHINEKIRADVFFEQRSVVCKRQIYLQDGCRRYIRSGKITVAKRISGKCNVDLIGGLHK